MKKLNDQEQSRKEIFDIRKILITRFLRLIRLIIVCNEMNWIHVTNCIWKCDIKYRLFVCFKGINYYKFIQFTI